MSTQIEDNNGFRLFDRKHHHTARVQASDDEKNTNPGSAYDHISGKKKQGHTFLSKRKGLPVKHNSRPVTQPQFFPSDELYFHSLLAGTEELVHSAVIKISYRYLFAREINLPPPKNC